MESSSINGATGRPESLWLPLRLLPTIRFDFGTPVEPTRTVSDSFVWIGLLNDAESADAYGVCRGLTRRRIGARRAADNHVDYWKDDPAVCVYLKEFELAIAGSVVALDQAGTGGTAAVESAPKQQFALVIAAPAPRKPKEMGHGIDVAVAPPPLQLLYEVATNGPRPSSAGALCMLLTSSVNRHYMTERTMPEEECSFEARAVAAVSSFVFRFEMCAAFSVATALSHTFMSRQRDFVRMRKKSVVGSDPNGCRSGSSPR